MPTPWPKPFPSITATGTAARLGRMTVKPQPSATRNTSALRAIGQWCLPARKIGKVSEPVTPSTGWAVLHLFCKLTTRADAEGVVAAVKAGRGDDYQVVTFAVLGHKADLGFMAVGPDLWRLRRLQSDLQAAGLEVVNS